MISSSQYQTLTLIIQLPSTRDISGQLGSHCRDGLCGSDWSAPSLGLLHPQGRAEPCRGRDCRPGSEGRDEPPAGQVELRCCSQIWDLKYFQGETTSCHWIQLFVSHCDHGSSTGGTKGSRSQDSLRSLPQQWRTLGARPLVQARGGSRLAGSHTGLGPSGGRHSGWLLSGHR